MLISDHIARLIETLIEDSGGSIELKRNDMAQQLGCAPSQINYVITSRFTPERGYIIESRRGGGGYIRIVRKTLHRNDFLVKLMNSVGDQLDENGFATILQALHNAKLCSHKEAQLAGALCSRTSLQLITDKSLRDTLRANMVRQMLLALMD